MRRVNEATYTAIPHLPNNLILLDRAAGSTVTLPKATGSGFVFKFVLSAAVTSNSTIIQVDNSTDVMAGKVLAEPDAAWPTAATSDTITLNGTTTGGLAGDEIELIDVAEGVWTVNGAIKQTGTAATPFSAAV